MNEVYPLVPLSDVLTERQEVPSADALIKGEICVIEKIGFNDGKIQLRTNSTTKTNMILIQPGDLVVSGINAAKGAIAIFDQKNTRPIAATIHYSSYIINKQKADIKYLWWLLRSHKFKELLLEYSPGGIKTELKAKRFLPIPIPLPPLEEQRRIVVRVEELVGKIEEVRSLRQKALEETEALVNSSAAKVFVELDTADFYQIDDISEVKGGIQKSSARTPGANPRRYITVAHVQRNSIDIGDPRYFEVSDEELDRWKLIAGDVLVIEGNGSPDHIGRAALFKGEIENCVHQNHVIRIRPNTVYITPEYLNTYLNSPIGKDQMLELSRTTSGLYTLSVGRIKSIKLPVPPLPEQRRIVAYLDELQTKIDTMKQLREEAIKELDAILPSILDKAFKGEL
jgi:type I restriction enzyme S subunit